MYYPNDIEEQCYEQTHIEQVITEIKKNIPGYLEKFIETEGGASVSDDKINKLAAKFGSSSGAKKKKRNGKNIDRIVAKIT